MTLQLLQRIIVSFIWITILSSCSEKNKWDGIWRGDAEVLPGFVTPLEFKIIKNKKTDNWAGRFEVVDLMAVGSFVSMSVSDTSIFLDFGGGGTLNGKFSSDNRTITAVIRSPDEDPDTVTFFKSNYWLSEMPARLDKKENPVTKWHYQAPSKTDDGWDVSALTVTQQEALSKTFEKVIDGEEFNGLDALLVAHGGRIVLEEYFHIGSQDKPHGIQSDTKSVNSLLFGIALQEGRLKSIDTPVERFFPHYTDTMKRSSWNVTVKDALKMAASLNWKEGEKIPYSDPENDAVRMNNSKDMYHFVLSHSQKEGETPGTTFSYNSGLSVLLGGVIQHATGLAADQYAKQTLFRDLGITKFNWFSFRGQAHTGGGLHLRPRDLLKIGHLVLDSGAWQNKQVVAKSWIRESTTFHLPTSESDIKAGYGYQWWRNSFNVGNSEYPYIYASGYGGQFLFIIPELDLVIVALNHMTSVQKGRTIISPKEIEELILPQFQN